VAAPSLLASLLDLEDIELDMFRGRTPPGGLARIYGGQVVAQSLAAAYRTVEGRVCHSLHAYFMRPGDPEVPILFQVERVRDGRSFGFRRVVAIQNGKQIFNLAASFQTPETGFEHHAPPPSAPPPEDLLNEEQLRTAHGEGPGLVWPVEVRPVDPWRHDKIPTSAPTYSLWFRAREALGGDIAVNQCALAFASDLSLLDASRRSHALDWGRNSGQVASLDHALWFHQPIRFSDWHLYVQDSPIACGGRGFNRGAIYSQDGRLVASASQDGLIRHRPTETPG